MSREWCDFGMINEKNSTDEKNNTHITTRNGTFQKMELDLESISEDNRNIN